MRCQQQKWSMSSRDSRKDSAVLHIRVHLARSTIRFYSKFLTISARSIRDRFGHGRRRFRLHLHGSELFWTVEFLKRFPDTGSHTSQAFYLNCECQIIHSAALASASLIWMSHAKGRNNRHPIDSGVFGFPKLASSA